MIEPRATKCPPCAQPSRSSTRAAGPTARDATPALTPSSTRCCTARTPEARTVASGEEEVLFVLSGHGELELARRASRARARGRRAPAAPSETYTLHPGARRCSVISVRVPARPGRTARDAWSAACATRRPRRRRPIGSSASSRRTPAATHFVGYIPTARAPDHFHTYDEVIYVLDGVGMMHAQGRDQPLVARQRRSSCPRAPSTVWRTPAPTSCASWRCFGRPDPRRPPTTPTERRPIPASRRPTRRPICAAPGVPPRRRSSK